MTIKPSPIVAVCALIDPDNRVLIQTRPTGKPMPGYWEFPGGKLNDDETPTAALVRELNEELGVTTFEAAFFPLTFITPDYDHARPIVLVYGCRNWRGPAAAQEGQDIAWVKPVRLIDHNLLPANRDIIPILRDMI